MTYPNYTEPRSKLLSSLEEIAPPLTKLPTSDLFICSMTCNDYEITKVLNDMIKEIVVIIGISLYLMSFKTRNPMCLKIKISVPVIET